MITALIIYVSVILVLSVIPRIFKFLDGDIEIFLYAFIIILWPLIVFGVISLIFVTIPFIIPSGIVYLLIRKTKR